MPGQMSGTFFGVLETDLRLLSAEAKKLDGVAHQIAGLFSHNDTPNIKESAESAVLKLRFLRNEANSLEALRQSPVRVLRQPTPL